MKVSDHLIHHRNVSCGPGVHPNKNQPLLLDRRGGHGCGGCWPAIDVRAAGSTGSPTTQNLRKRSAMSAIRLLSRDCCGGQRQSKARKPGTAVPDHEYACWRARENGRSTSDIRLNRGTAANGAMVPQADMEVSWADTSVSRRSVAAGKNMQRRSFSSSGYFPTMMGHAFDSAGLGKRCVPHGLRTAAARQLAEACQA